MPVRVVEGVEEEGAVVVQLVEVQVAVSEMVRECSPHTVQSLWIAGIKEQNNTLLTT